VTGSGLEIGSIGDDTDSDSCSGNGMDDVSRPVCGALGLGSDRLRRWLWTEDDAMWERAPIAGEGVAVEESVMTGRARL
jgi:hypothetical protein